MNLPKSNKIDWEAIIEFDSTIEWKPFPDLYVRSTSDFHAAAKQISSKIQRTHVISNIFQDFFADVIDISLDEDNAPSKVYGWNDISNISFKAAKKSLINSLTAEYMDVFKDATVEAKILFDSSDFNYNNYNFPQDFLDLVVFHIFNPKIIEKQNLKKKAKLSSYSSNKLKRISSLVSSTSSLLSTSLDSFQDFAKSISCDKVFIFDCPFAANELSSVSEKITDFYGFAATRDNLPFVTKLPCDLFTSCMLTPTKMAILIQSFSYENINSGILSPIDLQEMINIINENEDSHEIFETLESSLEQYADRIAFETLENNLDLFYKVFRHSPAIAKLFYHFMLACRLMRYVSAIPVSYPTLPDMTNHPLWESFDLQVDRAIYSLKGGTKEKFSKNILLEEQMEQLENWLCFLNSSREMPDELSSLELLLDSNIFFERAIKFTSIFVTISPYTTSKFLDTRAFPVLVRRLKNLQDFDKSVLSDYSRAIAAILSYSNELKDFFIDSVDFWKTKLIETDDESFIVPCLCCLLQFPYDKSLIPHLSLLTEHKSYRIRTLSHLLLGKMSVILELPIQKISNEESPLCRAALISRMTPLFNNNPHMELFYDLFINLNDAFSFVRDETLKVLSHAIMLDNSFCGRFEPFLIHHDENIIKDPLIALFIRFLYIFTYEPSKLMRKRFIEFLQFLDSKLKKKKCIPLQSVLESSFVSEIIHIAEDNEEDPMVFVSPTLIVPQSSKLTGKPSISLSGLLACSTVDGTFYCQFGQETRYYNYFEPQINLEEIPSQFLNIFTKRYQNKSNIVYSAYIDDYKFLAINNRSQVIVIDSNIQDDVLSSFWIEDPDICKTIIADYNSITHQIIGTSTSRLISLFDLESQKRKLKIKIDDKRITYAQWLKPFSSIVIASSQEYSYLYDVRQQNKIISFDNGNDSIVGCNSSYSLPYNLISGMESGKITMYDIRMMNVYSSCSVRKPIKQFDIHKNLPFSFGLTTASQPFTLMFDSGIPEIEFINTKTGIDSFSLNHRESTCAIRNGNIISTVDIQLNL